MAFARFGRCCVCERLYDEDGKRLYVRGRVVGNCVCFPCFVEDGLSAPGRKLQITHPGRWPEGDPDEYLSREIQGAKPVKRRR